VELLLVCVLTLLAGAATRHWRPVRAVITVLSAGIFYVLLARYLYVADRLWLPIVAPMSGLLLTHFGLIAHRAFSEQNERRRIKEVFAKIVSPGIVNELLRAENLSVVGARRRVTLSFADVRGFTQLTDSTQARAEQYVRQNQVVDQAADSYFDSQSRDLLRTINLYLGLMADIVKKHDGTLDKYIGDCVMAFWGAPAPNEKHALTCVRAAIESQQAICALNLKRAAENRDRAEQNRVRLIRGEEPVPILDLLVVGIGINTGIVTVGLMGSDTHVYNYTVFGRDVNVASRIEGCSAGGRIIIGEATYFELLHDAPELAKTCLELEPVAVRGISTPIKIFEVPWQFGSNEPARNLDLELETLMPVMTLQESALNS
jgi:adenylate cyclase